MNDSLQGQMQSQMIMAAAIQSGEAYTCERCGHDRFTLVYLIKKISALVSPTGRDTIVPMSCFACISCHHINEDLLPDAIQE